MAAFPSKEIAELSWKFRTLGLGYANLAMLMQAGIPYDTEEGRAVCGAISAIMTGRSYASALLAVEHGPFDGFQENRNHMLRVIRNHRRAAHGVAREDAEWEDPRSVRSRWTTSLPRRPGPLGNAQELIDRCMLAWDDALRSASSSLPQRPGHRDRPDRHHRLLMDCDTTGVEPDFALTKFASSPEAGTSRSRTSRCGPRFPPSGTRSPRPMTSSPGSWAP